MTKAHFHRFLAIFISLATLLGLALHETKTDTLTGTLVGIPAVIASYSGIGALAALQSDAHTHVEHVSVASINGAVHQTSYVPPRYSENKQHLLQKNTPRGHHPFDNYTLPIVS